MAEKAPKATNSGDGSRRRDPTAPKGRPTPGRRERNARARAAARRRRLHRRLWWTAGAVVFVGLLVFFIVAGVGGTGSPLG